MNYTVHNYLQGFIQLVDLAKDNSLADQIKAFRPVVADSGELFYRNEEDDVKRDKLVYMFFDGSQTFRKGEINVDFSSEHPCAYIGMGTTTRPTDHYLKRAKDVNGAFRDWLEYMQKNNKPVNIVIYAMGMADDEAKALEADLIELFSNRQSIVSGVQWYRNRPNRLRLFNKKTETSNQTVYSVNGIRHKKF